MRVSLAPDTAEFAKQVAGLRRSLTDETVRGTGQASVSARFMLSALVPYLGALRTELRDDVMPEHVMTGAADLLANIALTTVESIVDASPLKVGEIVEQLLAQATHIACQRIAEVSAKAVPEKPPLKLVQGGPTSTVIHMPKGGK